MEDILTQEARFNRMPDSDNTAGYWTHICPLATVVMNTTGPILELGCGDYSTPLLHALCAPSKREILTCDSQISWMELFTDLERDWHRFTHVTDWDWISWSTLHRSNIVFVDHDTDRRAVDIKRLRDTTAIFVVHDCEKNRWYKYGNLFSTFKYQYIYRRYTKQTIVLSDTVDVSKFFEL